MQFDIGIKLILCLLPFSLAIIFFSKDHNKAGLIFLLFGALCLRLFIISLDPFLHDWDERYHALVAKNMMTDPFRPTLQITPLLAYDYKAWRGKYI